MYPFKTRTKNAPRVRFPVDDNESQLGLPDSSVFFAKTPNTAAIIRRCTSMPETGKEQHPGVEIKRTLSGGLLFGRKKRSIEKQVEISRARALEMSERYELSDTKEESLNKSASFKTPITGTPCLSATMTAKQASKVFGKKQLEAKKKTTAADPLLTERERKGKERRELIKQRKIALARTSPSSQLSRAPLSLKQMNTVGRSQNSRFPFTKPHSSQGGKNEGSNNKGYKSGDDTLPKSMGMEIIPLSPSSVSVAPTEAETPSPRGHRESYQQTFHLPSMC
jgi:hypothetical protein